MKRHYILLGLLVLQVNRLIAQDRYAIIIDEIMADPSPVVGLPNNEWIELRNTSSLPFNLQGWRIGDASGQSGPMPSFVLQPDSFVIICGSGSVAALSVFGKALAVTSFPSLDNETDQLFLKSSNNKIIHAIEYADSWYGNELKKNGGWSLEMTDTKNPCSGKSNWKASIALKGGTPGAINSVNSLNTDNTPPQITNAYTTDSTTIILLYDEPVDSTIGATPSNYSIDGGLAIVHCFTMPPLFNSVQLKTNTPLKENSIYTISISHVTDCRGNVISTVEDIQTGIPADPKPGELVINEILFDPKPNGYDYIELYNNSKNIFDVSRLFVTNRNSNSQLTTPILLSSQAFYLFPGKYVVITEDADNLAMNYLVSDPKVVLPVASLPSMPDAKGSVVVLNSGGTIIDEVDYDATWHFKLLSDAEGVALERIDPNSSSQDPHNWHSAASTAGYGTPGYKNSQYRDQVIASAVITIDPPVVSPDNDGFNDIVSIKYVVDEPGYVANIILFDAAGRPVRDLVKNNILGRSGYWNWDGLNDKQQKLPVGVYIVVTELFNLQGKKIMHKNTVTVARRLQ